MNARLAGSREGFEPKTERLDAAESSLMLGDYIGQLVRRVLDTVDGENAVSDRVALCNRLIAWLAEQVHDPEVIGWRVCPEAEVLLAISTCPMTRGARDCTRKLIFSIAIPGSRAPTSVRPICRVRR